MIIMSDTVDRTDKDPATISNSQNEEAVGKALHPLPTETMERVRKREKDNSGFTDIDDIDWDEL